MENKNNWDLSNREGAGGLFDLIYGILFDPSRTFAKITPHPPLAAAAAIFVTLSLLDGLAGLFMTPLSFEDVPFPGGAGVELIRALLPFLFVGGFTLAMIKWFIMSGLLHLVAELFGGQGRARGVFTVYGLASLPVALILPLNILVFLVFSGTARTVLSGFLELGTFIWTLVLLIMGLGQVHRLSTGRAVLTVVTPALVLLAWLVLVIFILVAAISHVPVASPYFKLF